MGVFDMANIFLKLGNYMSKISYFAIKKSKREN